MVQTLTLLSLGVLNSQWTPPGSCLSTTTAWGNSYFLGYHKDAGHDPQCIPNVAAAPTVSVVTTNGLTPSTYTTTIAPSPTITAIAQLMPSADQNISSVGYYSPGICPSGFIYAASFTAGLPGAGKESRYICCPSGFLAEKGTSTRVRTTKGGRRTTRITTYEYPLCTQSARTITNLWSMTPGWPSVRPSSYNVSQTSTTNRNSKSVFSITASGIVVAWNPTDTPVVDYIRNNNIQLPP
ncbi:hypothetical protein P152DRAFT_173266 [Eremomyces bilateralis CBS 781.70]|uniref:Uncharacterized protein n=1 Tax=Eremomyces bilateralis CBS 781.70 TaxID=1392243 RepID=A0A6G1FTM3_9PEZI|nr:uncharacterized protein P152DRAFT_173266 [Eremomyces bilateralis CBS 781.70]KAF1809011.1 hypothetical protein P152DRAFT_173266 [Eremomyces bilateralis CBS 781.70]